jgi:hypothetical protein
VESERLLSTLHRSYGNRPVAHLRIRAGHDTISPGFADIAYRIALGDILGDIIAHFIAKLAISYRLYRPKYDTISPNGRYGGRVMW